MGLTRMKPSDIYDNSQDSTGPIFTDDNSLLSKGGSRGGGNLGAIAPPNAWIFEKRNYNIDYPDKL